MIKEISLEDKRKAANSTDSRSGYSLSGVTQVQNQRSGYSSYCCGQ